MVKQEMARVNIDTLGIRELKWTGMYELHSDDHYIITKRLFAGHLLIYSMTSVTVSLNNGLKKKRHFTSWISTVNFSFLFSASHLYSHPSHSALSYKWSVYILFFHILLLDCINLIGCGHNWLNFKTIPNLLYWPQVTSK